MIRINGYREITDRDIAEAYKKYPNEELLIVIPNTKKQNPQMLETIAKRFPNVKFSVIGGLDPTKNKFNNTHYQKRTYYSPMELKNIVEIYRDIEKRINLDWTETQKAMFIYQQLCNRMQYSEIFINGRDYARGIGGLLYNKAVCSGFAMIYKEALDRIGIECHYQNMQSNHSWNIAKLDGKYRALELTWDTYTKDKNGCGFRFFNREGSDFYKNENHDLTYETEETRFPITAYTDKELVDNYKVISQPRFMPKPLQFQPGEKIKTIDITVEESPCKIIKAIDGRIDFKCIDNKAKLTSKSFLRKDGSHFALVK